MKRSKGLYCRKKQISGTGDVVEGLMNAVITGERMKMGECRV